MTNSPSLDPRTNSAFHLHGLQQQRSFVGEASISRRSEQVSQICHPLSLHPFPLFPILTTSAAIQSAMSDLSTSSHQSRTTARRSKTGFSPSLNRRPFRPAAPTLGPSNAAISWSDDDDEVADTSASGPSSVSPPSRPSQPRLVSAVPRLLKPTPATTTQTLLLPPPVHHQPSPAASSATSSASTSAAGSPRIPRRGRQLQGSHRILPSEEDAALRAELARWQARRKARGYGESIHLQQIPLPPRPASDDGSGSQTQTQRHSPLLSDGGGSTSGGFPFSTRSPAATTSRRTSSSTRHGTAGNSGSSPHVSPLFPDDFDDIVPLRGRVQQHHLTISALVHHGDSGDESEGACDDDSCGSQCSSISSSSLDAGGGRETSAERCGSSSGGNDLTWSYSTATTSTASSSLASQARSSSKKRRFSTAATSLVRESSSRMQQSVSAQSIGSPSWGRSASRKSAAAGMDVEDHQPHPAIAQRRRPLRVLLDPSPQDQTGFDVGSFSSSSALGDVSDATTNAAAAGNFGLGIGIDSVLQLLSQPFVRESTIRRNSVTCPVPREEDPLLAGVSLRSVEEMMDPREMEKTVFLHSDESDTSQTPRTVSRTSTRTADRGIVPTSLATTTETRTKSTSGAANDAGQTYASLYARRLSGLPRQLRGWSSTSTADSNAGAATQTSGFFSASLRQLGRLPNLLLNASTFEAHAVIDAVRPSGSSADDESTLRTESPDHKQPDGHHPPFVRIFDGRGVMSPIQADAAASAYVSGLGDPLDPDLELSSVVHLETFRSSFAPPSSGSRSDSGSGDAETDDEEQRQQRHDEEEDDDQEQAQRATLANHPPRGRPTQVPANRRRLSPPSSRQCAVGLFGGGRASHSSRRSGANTLDVPGSSNALKTVRSSPELLHLARAAALANEAVDQQRRKSGSPIEAVGDGDDQEQEPGREGGRGRAAAVKIVSAAVDPDVRAQQGQQQPPPDLNTESKSALSTSSAACFKLAMEQRTTDVGSTTPVPKQRLLANGAHLLMLSLELEMIRKRKISAPLKPRWGKQRSRLSPTPTSSFGSQLKQELESEGASPVLT